ncbi:hypothetical protein K8T06_17185 [bacterium]|nr:hypothetical protein [bacterium]
MNYWYLITISISVLVLFWGFWASFKTEKPWNIIGSICTPIALITAIISVLLLCVPDFFG